MANIYEKVGEKIKKLRKKVDITQEKLAEKARLDFTSVQNIESGIRNPSLKTLNKIANALNVPIRDLFD